MYRYGARQLTTFKGEVRVHNKLCSNERSYIAYLAYKVSCLQIKCKSINKALKLLKFAYCAAAIIYIGPIMQQIYFVMSLHGSLLVLFSTEYSIFQSNLRLGI